MTEQNPAPGTADETESDDIQGHMKRQADDQGDDTQGHLRHKGDDQDDDDTQGHMKL